MIGKQINILVRQFNLFLNRELSDINVSATEILYLAALYRKDGLTQEDLAAEYVVDKAAVARTVKNMEKKGLIVRIDNPKNRRQKQIHLTAKAKDLKPSLQEIQDRWTRMMTEGEDPAVTETVVSYLDRVVARSVQLNHKEGKEEME